MLKRLFSSLLIVLCLFSCLVIPAFAAEESEPVAEDMFTEFFNNSGVSTFDLSAHEYGHVSWTYDDTNYHLGIKWGTSYRNIPMYITWYNDGITIFVDANDCSSSYTPTLYMVTGTWGGMVVTKTSFSMTQVTDSFGAEKSYYMYTFANNVNYFGLQFSSLSAFRDSYNADETTIWYLEDIELSEWSEAVNLNDVDFATSDEGNEDESGNILDWLKGTWATFIDGFNLFIEDISSALSECLQFLKDIFNKIVEFIDGIPGLIELLFVPSEDFLENVVNDTNTAIDNSEFLLTVKLFVQEIDEFLKQDFTEPPSIVVDLSDAEGKYNYGVGNVNVLDVSWFNRYRQYTDPFLSFVFWITFLWLIAKRLPDLLNGAGMISSAPVNVASSIERNRANEARAAEREQRAAERAAAREHSKSYEAYKENRQRNEAYSARYKNESKGGK